MVKSLYSPAQLAKVRNCQECGTQLVRSAKESPSAFMARSFCDRACSNRWKNAQMKGKPNPNLRGGRNGMYGRRHTDAAKEMQRQAAKAHPLSAEKQRENALKRIGSRRPQSTRDRMSQARSGWWDRATPEQRKQHSDKVTKSGREMRAFHSERMRVWLANLTPEQRAQRNRTIRIATLAAYPKPVYRRTSIERTMAAALDGLGVRYDWNAPLLSRFNVDFLLTDYPVVIECDGDYWHSLPRIVKRDAVKNRDIPAAGYTLLRFSETSINTDLAGCVQRIVDTLRELDAATIG